MKLKINLRETLLITLLFVALVPLIFLLMHNLWSFSNDEREDKENALNRSMSVISTHFDYDSSHLATALKNTSDVLDSVDFDKVKENPEKLQLILHSIKATSDLDILTIIDKDKHVISRANNTIIGDKLEVPAIFQKAFDGNLVVGVEVLSDELLKNEGDDLLDNTKLAKIFKNDPTREEFDETKSIFLIGITPIFKNKSKKDEIIGVVFVARLLSSEFISYIKDLQGMSDIRVSLESYTGDDIKPSSDMLVKRIRGYDNKPVANLIVWYDPTKNTKMFTDAQTTTIYMYIIVSILLFGASVSVSKYLSAPLQKLDDAAREIANENFSTHVEVSGPIEYIHLSQAFNNMALSLAEKRRMQENFVATLTHDMRVPLLAEKKALSILLDDRFELDKNQKLILDNMFSSNEDLLKLVNTLLDTYKLEAGKYKLTIFEEDIIALIKQVITEIKPLVDENQHTIIFEPNIDQLKIMIDKGEMKRVMCNLLSNAIKFTPSKGVIKVNIESDVEKIVVSVSDNGKGIADEDKELLFQRYSSTAKKLRKVGTGLGLYLSYQIVLAHGGIMWVDTKLNCGTTFYFSVPKNLN